MRVVVGVDSGGSRTRALAVSLDGEAGGYVETGGGNPTHDEKAGANVADAIRRAGAGHEIVRIVAGVAGIDTEKDEARVAAALSEFDAPKFLVNDAAVAHFAAFGDGPGIVSIQGTGSTIRAVLEDGRIVRNGDFLHYARGGAVWVGIRAVHKLLKDPMAAREEALREAACRVWEVDSVESLREAVSRQFNLSSFERSRRYGELAQAVTASAQSGGLSSQGVCSFAVREIVDGITILGPMFASEEVCIAFVGACVRSEPILRGVVDRLLTNRIKRYRIVKGETPPVVGAALRALREQGLEPVGEMSERLAEFVAASTRYAVSANPRSGVTRHAPGKASIAPRLPDPSPLPLSPGGERGSEGFEGKA